MQVQEAGGKYREPEEFDGEKLEDLLEDKSIKRVVVFPAYDEDGMEKMAPDQGALTILTGWKVKVPLCGVLKLATSPGSLWARKRQGGQQSSLRGGEPWKI